MDEPRYAPADPYEDEYNPRAKPKWLKPKTYVERLMLSSVGRQNYRSEAEYKSVQRIVKEVSEDNSGIYPISWVKNCCEWVIGKRERGHLVQMKGLLTAIGNHERKREFLDKQKEHKGYKPKFQGG